MSGPASSIGSPAKVTSGAAALGAHRGGRVGDVLRRLFRQLSPRRRAQLLLLAGLMLIGALAELVTIGAVLPFLALIANPGSTADIPLIGPLLGQVNWRGGSLLLPAAIAFVLVAVVAGAIRLLLVWASQKFVFRLGHDLGVEVYRRTLYQPYAYHIARNSSAVIADINKVQMVVGSILMPFVQAISASVISFFIISALIIVNVFVAIVAIVGFGSLYLGISAFTRRHLRSNSKVISATQADRIKTVQEGLGGIRDVLLDQAQMIYVRKFSRVDSAYRDAQTTNAFANVAPRYVIEAVGMVLIAGLAVVMSGGEGGLSAALPALGALALGAVRVLPLLQIVYSSWSQLSGNFQSLLDVLEVLERPLSTAGHLRRKHEPPLPFVREIVLEKLGFTYQPGGRKVLEAIDLVIPRGAKVGIVGRTGSGKSTLMDLLMGLLEPTEGRITIDAEPLTTANVSRWQALIAHVPQAIYLSDGTISENIAFAVPVADIDHARLSEAAQQAAVSEFVRALPEAYQTIVGERGVRLSGGQRQRIGIARALYRQPDVIVFDEATSALDNHTEGEVMAAVARLRGKKTIFMAAHRLSTVRHCDMIIVMDGGRIADCGSYGWLLENSQVFQMLATAEQAAGTATADRNA